MILFMLKMLQGLLDCFPTLELDIPSIEPINETLNLFAWARALLPVDLILVLIGLTGLYYGFKVSFSFIKYIIKIILK